MQSDALTLVLERNRFYRRQYFLALAALMLSYLVIALLIGALLFLKRNPTRPVYFATDSIGRLFPVIPVSQPNMPLNDVMAWVREAIETTYSYDYINFREQQQSAQKYFTNYGWTRYLTALSASGNLLALKENKMVVEAQVVDTPRVIVQGILAGAYAIKFEVPVLITYWKPPYDDRSKFVNPLTVTLIVQRQSVLQSYKGLGIVQIIGAVPVGAPNQPAALTNTPTG